MYVRKQDEDQHRNNDVGIIDKEFIRKFRKSIAKIFVVFVVEIYCVLFRHFQYFPCDIFVPFVYLIDKSNHFS